MALRFELLILPAPFADVYTVRQRPALSQVSTLSVFSIDKNAPNGYNI
jgi:hypothetical protein